MNVKQNKKIKKIFKINLFYKYLYDDLSCRPVNTNLIKIKIDLKKGFDFYARKRVINM